MIDIDDAELGSPEQLRRLMEGYRQKLVKIITRHIPSCTILLFGSRARGTFKEGAYIDIALNTGSKIEHSIILAIYVDIDRSTIPVHVDVVDMHSVSDEMKREIIRDAILWLEKG